MLGNFDPYHEWLGIPPEEQPPSFYRILGLAEGESDTTVISRAAGAQAAHVRSVRTDENAIFVDLLIKEIAAAKELLLDPEKKKKYDRQQAAKPRPPWPPTVTSVPAAGLPSDSSVLGEPSAGGSAVGHSGVHPPGGSTVGLSGVPPTGGSAVGQSGVQAAGTSGVHGSVSSPSGEARRKKNAGGLPAWAFLVIGGGIGVAGLAVALVLMIFVFGDPDDDAVGPGPGPAVASGGDDKTDGKTDGGSDDKQQLAFEPVEDFSVAPGSFVRIPLVVANLPDDARLTIVSGPDNAKVTPDKKTLAWQTGPADAGTEHQVTVCAQHSAYRTGQLTLTVRVGATDEPAVLLDLVDVDADAVAGKWQKVEDALLSPHADNHPRMVVPFAVPESYDLSIDVEKLGGDSGLQIGLASGPTRWSVFLDGPTGSGLTRVDGNEYHLNVTSYREPLFRVGDKSKLKCRVRPSRVQVVCDGTTIINFRGDPSRLSRPNEWQIPDPRFVSLGAQKASYRLSNMVLTPVPAGSTDPTHALSDEIPGLVEYEGHRYKVFYEQLPWAEARRRCEELGGHLAYVEDGLEQSYVAGIPHRPQAWLGGTDQQQEGQWRWLNGAPLEYTRWNTGRPDNQKGNENYLCMTGSGAWDDEAGHVPLGYICEWGPEPTVTPPVAPPPAVAVEPPPTRIPRVAVPPDAELGAFVAKFRTYVEKQSLDTRDKRAAFVRRMIALAAEPDKSMAERYVLLRESQRVATEHGDAVLAVEAIDTLERYFEIDPLPAKQQSLLSAFQRSTDPNQLNLLKTNLVNLVHDAWEQDACDAALQIAQDAYNQTLKPSKKQFRSELYDLRKQARQHFDQWEEFREVEQALAQDPDDPQANLTVGSRYCFRRGDWKAGLPLLAKSQDPTLTALAEAELAEPTTAQEHLKLADAWWSAASSQDDTSRRSVLRHAADWYERARPDITDADQLARIDERMRQLADLQQAEVTETRPVDEPTPTIDVEKLGLFDGRSGEARVLLVQARGGSEETERAVAAALEWLAKHQMPDGGWTFDHAVAVGGAGSNGGNMPQARNAATGLVLLAMLGAGHTHKSGKYQQQVQRGLGYLVNRMKVQKDRSGSLSEEGGTMYSHGIATQALCEAYAMTEEKSLQLHCQMALAYIIRGQHLGGGWRYKPKEPGDTSVTGWQLTALKLGSAGGIQAPPTTFAQTVKFLDMVQYDGGAKYGYQKPGGTDGTTAIGLLCRIYLGWPHDQVALERGVTNLSHVDPANRPMYVNYHVTQVLQNHGGEPWEKWNTSIRKHLLSKQAAAGNATGSWFLPDKHSAAGGRLCCTALATLILESYYRYLPAYPETRQEIAERLNNPPAAAEPEKPAAAAAAAD
jgi:hypothetical protein